MLSHPSRMPLNFKKKKREKIESSCQLKALHFQKRLLRNQDPGEEKQKTN